MWWGNKVKAVEEVRGRVGRWWGWTCRWGWREKGWVGMNVRLWECGSWGVGERVGEEVGVRGGEE